MSMEDDDKRTYEEMLDKPKSATEAAVASVLKEVDEAKKAKRVRFEEGKAPLFPDAKGKAPMVEMETEGDAKDEGPIMEVRINYPQRVEPPIESKGGRVRRRTSCVEQAAGVRQSIDQA